MSNSNGAATIAGTRIRERRREIGLAQAELAQRVGVSASYLNLIEHNRRRIGGKLLLDIAQALAIAPQFLSEGAEVAKIEALRTAAARLPEVAVEDRRSQEFAERFPGWANLLLEQSALIERLERTVSRLSDRLAHDPQLAASLHEMISTVTAIRSSAAILKDTPDLDPQWRDRFQRNVFEESERLVAGSRRLAAHLDSAGGNAARGRMPQDQVQAFLRRHRFRFPELESDGARDPREIVEADDTLGSSLARALALAHLERYRADAALAPATRLAAAMDEAEGDPVRAAGALGLGLPVVLRRVAALPTRHGSPEPGLAICDGSGALAFAKPAEGFDITLFGHACPLWPLYLALQRPMTPLARVIELPGESGARFTSWSFAEQSWPGGLDAPPLVEATMLVLPGADTGQRALPVGMTCAVCPREGCASRHEPWILAPGV